MKSLFFRLKVLGFKKSLALFILAAADVFVIAAPYYLKSIVPNVQLYLHVKESDMSTFTAIIGWVTLLTQLPGGWLADKFSSKKMLSISVFMTGVITVWFGTLALVGSEINYESLFAQYSIIFALWGISTTPLFWTPLWKLVSQQTEKEEQGFAYGLQGSFNGLIGLIFVFGIGTAITLYTRNYEAQNPGNPLYAPFASYIYVFAFLMIISSIGIWFFVKEKKTKEKFAVDMKVLIKVMQDWKIWALSIFVMGMYMFQSVFSYYLTQMMQNIIGIPTAIILVIGGIRLYGMRMTISTFAGRFADRFKSIILLLIIVLFIGLAVSAIMIMIPGFGSHSFDNYSGAAKITASIFFASLFLISSALSWMMVTLRYAQTVEIDRPKNSYGAVTAMVSLVAFSPDAWFYQIGSSVISNNQVQKMVDGKLVMVASQTAYQVIGLLAIFISFIGLIAGLFVYIATLKQNKEYGLKFFRWRELNNG